MFSGLIMSVVDRLFDFVAPALLDKRRVRFTMHRASFNDTGRQAFLFTVTNLSRSRDIELTHVWIDSSPPVPAINGERPLPKRLRPDEIWETWIFVDDVPQWARKFALNLGRARLSTGRTLKAKENKNVPPAGTVPGP